MEYNDFAEHFIDRIAQRGAVHVTSEHVWQLVAAFPLVGGGAGCIVLVVVVVRLVQGPNAFWFAEHLVVRGADS